MVTFVSLMVHIYTIGYMADDPGYQRFFSYISLFTFSMLMLVMSNNFLQLFFGWEAVGLVSYLLIGFWYTRPTAIYANLKAFLVNRVGDFGFLLGIGLIVAYVGTLDYARGVRQGAASWRSCVFPGTDWMLITVICICLFIGAMGKSAQFPLHVWLPDSMEGPTPISALIHAATMVTAGIFMVARMSPLFELSDTALSFVLVIGAITALFMGFLGIIQNDIKRVVAYSTLSQLGYMTVALGASAYSVAVFHLMTHAFFKALLFLGAGSVIIGMHHDQDIRNMGGLRKYMPITWITSLLGSLALIGTPLFAGFYSKDSDHRGGARRAICRAPGFAYFACWPACSSPRSIRSACTSWSSTARSASARRHEHMPTTATHDDEEPSDDHHHGLRPGRQAARVAVGRDAAAGAAGDSVGRDRLPDHRPDAVRRLLQGRDRRRCRRSIRRWRSWPRTSTAPLAMALHGLTDAAVLARARRRRRRPGTSTCQAAATAGGDRSARSRPIYTLLDNKYYFDAFNETSSPRGARVLGTGPVEGRRPAVIDGVLVNGSARADRRLRRVLAGCLQTGYLYHYAFAMIVGVIVLHDLAAAGRCSPASIGR